MHFEDYFLKGHLLQGSVLVGGVLMAQETVGVCHG